MISYAGSCVAFGLTGGPWAFVAAVVLGYLYVSSWFAFWLFGCVCWLALLVVLPTVLMCQGRPRHACLSFVAVLIASFEAWNFWRCDWQWEDCFYFVWSQLLWLAYASAFLAFWWVFIWLITRFEPAAYAADNDNGPPPPTWYALVQASFLASYYFFRLVLYLVASVPFLALYGVTWIRGCVDRLWLPHLPIQPVRHQVHLVHPSLDTRAAPELDLARENDYPQVAPRKMPTTFSRGSNAWLPPLRKVSLSGDPIVPIRRRPKTDEAWPGWEVAALRMSILMDRNVDRETHCLVRDSFPFLPPLDSLPVKSVVLPVMPPPSPLPAPVVSAGVADCPPPVTCGFRTALTSSVLQGPVDTPG